MSDKRFKWLLIAASLTCVIVAFICKYPEAVKANATKDTTLGKYLYIDPRSNIHVSRKCPKLNYKGWKSIRIKTDEIGIFIQNSDDRNPSFCPHCVSDKDYEILINK